MFIADLNITLENVIKQNKERFMYLDDKHQEAQLAEFDVSFNNPSTLTNISRTTFDLFLFDLRENDSLRSGDTGMLKYEKISKSDKKDDFEIRVVPPYMRVACSYLVTIWPKVTGDPVLNEQAILGQLFQLFAGFPDIPEEYLYGGLKKDENMPLPIVELMQEIGPKNRYDFWNLLKIDLHPSFVLTITISVPIYYHGKEIDTQVKRVGGIGVNVLINNQQKD